MQAQLKQDLANIVSAEVLFVLTDLCGLSPHDAIDSVIHAARCDGVGRGTCPSGTHVLTIDLK